MNRVNGVIHRDCKNPGRSIHLRCISNLRDFFLAYHYVIGIKRKVVVPRCHLWPNKANNFNNKNFYH